MSFDFLFPFYQSHSFSASAYTKHISHTLVWMAHCWCRSLARTRSSRSFPFTVHFSFGSIKNFQFLCSFLLDVCPCVCSRAKMALVLGCRCNKCCAPAVCWCVFVFVSHSFLYSHILSDAVSNHSTTCCVAGWNYTSPFICSVGFVRSRRLRLRLCKSRRLYQPSSLLPPLFPPKISSIEKVVDLSLYDILIYQKSFFLVQFSLSLSRSNSKAKW